MPLFLIILHFYSAKLPIRKTRGFSTNIGFYCIFYHICDGVTPLHTILHNTYHNFLLQRVIHSFHYLFHISIFLVISMLLRKIHDFCQTRKPTFLFLKNAAFVYIMQKYSTVFPIKNFSGNITQKNIILWQKSKPTDVYFRSWVFSLLICQIFTFRPDPWWQRHSDPGSPSYRHSTHSSPGHRSWRRCRRTTSGAAGTALHRLFGRLSPSRRE